MQLDLPDSFWQWHKEYQPDHYVIACSGGIDSMVLLDLCRKTSLNCKITVVYVNHGWHPAADSWGNLVSDYCQKYQLHFQAVSLDLAHVTANKEAIARDKRYAAFSEFMTPSSVLLTAHHQNDQAETLLINLLRGSGLKGLAAMPARKRFSLGEHWRPLLYVDKAEIIAYAAQNNLPYVDDPSNEDTDFTRNWLRCEILPMLSQRNDKAIQSIAKSAQLLGRSFRTEQKLLARQLEISDAGRLQLSCVADRSIDEQTLLIRCWLDKMDYPMPPQQQLEEWLRQINSGGAHPQINFHSLILLKHRDEIMVLADGEIAAAPEEIAENVAWKGIGELTIRSAVEAIPKTAYWTIYPPGGPFRPAGQQHHKSLKEWFRRRKVPPLLRARTPILRTDDEILWVGELGAAAEYNEIDILWQK